MKTKRQEKIIDIVTKNEIGTQEALIDALRAAGCNVTQATVSRDIRELKLLKVPTGHGEYKYVVPHPSETAGSNMRLFNNALAESILNVDYAYNNIVIKTYPGLAGAVATGIDSLKIDEILGCVAGDDAIIMVLRDEYSARDISERIRQLIRE